MNIVIEARALSASMGVKTYTEQLIRHAVALGEHTYTIVYDHPRHLGTFPTTREVVLHNQSEMFLPWWLQVRLPRLLKRLAPNIVHFTKADMPARLSVPAMVTIYDVIPLLFPQSQKFLQRNYWPRALRRAATLSHHIMTISEASKRDIVTQFNVPASKITVTPLAADVTHFKKTPVVEITRVMAKYGIERPYILFVGTWEPRKNIPALVQAFNAVAGEVPHQLVIAGKKGWKYQAIEALIHASPFNNRIKEIAYVDYADLPGLYSGADVFVWPSVYEGWGLPVQEAQACGTPVIVSDGGALPEVVGESGIIVPFTTMSVPERLHDAEFAANLNEALLQLLHDSSRRQDLRQAGLAHSHRFTWEAVAAKTIEQYAKLT